MANNNPTFVLPKGVAVYPRLNKPDTKYHELGEYKANVKMPLETAQPIIDKIQKIAKEHIGKALPKSKNATFEMVVDDNGDETGEVLFKIKTKNRMTKKGDVWDRKPLIIDAKKVPLSSELSIGGGSVMKVKVEVYCYDMPKKGINLQPIAVQILDLKEWKGDVDTSDFDEEDGYTAQVDDDMGDDDIESTAFDADGGGY